MGLYACVKLIKNLIKKKNLVRNASRVADRKPHTSATFNRFNKGVERKVVPKMLTQCLKFAYDECTVGQQSELCRLIS